MVSHHKMQMTSIETFKDIDSADYPALLTNTPVQAECLLHSLEQAARGIDLYMNLDKTEFMCFKQAGAISALNGRPLKLVNPFTYLGSSISSIERNVNICIGKAWTDY